MASIFLWAVDLVRLWVDMGFKIQMGMHTVSLRTMGLGFQYGLVLGARSHVGTWLGNVENQQPVHRVGSFTTEYSIYTGKRYFFSKRFYSSSLLEFR